MQVQHETTSIWTTVATVAAGAGLTGLAALLKVWYENKRLLKKDYRRSMSERIAELEHRNDRCQAETEMLREEVRVLTEKCDLLRSLFRDR